MDVVRSCDQMPSILFVHFAFIYHTQASSSYNSDETVDETEDQLNDLPDNLSDDHPEDLLDDPPDNLKEDQTYNLVEDLPDNLVEDQPDNLIEGLPDNILEDLPDNLLEDMPGNLLEDMPDNLLEDLPHNLLEDLPNALLEDLSNDLSGDPTEGLQPSEKTPNTSGNDENIIDDAAIGSSHKKKKRIGESSNSSSKKKLKGRGKWVSVPIKIPQTAKRIALLEKMEEELRVGDINQPLRWEELRSAVLSKSKHQQYWNNFCEKVWPGWKGLKNPDCEAKVYLGRVKGEARGGARFKAYFHNTDPNDGACFTSDFLNCMCRYSYVSGHTYPNTREHFFVTVLPDKGYFLLTQYPGRKLYYNLKIVDFIAVH